MQTQKVSIALILIAIMATTLNGCKKSDSSEAPPEKIQLPLFNSSKTYGTMTDQDGNLYKTITIGTQTWMAENLRVTKYRNNDPIPLVTDNANWTSVTTGAYCSPDNNSNEDNISAYGRLYNWFAVPDNRNIAPQGWHIPTKAEWSILISKYGDEIYAGNKFRETGTTHWRYTYSDVTNESGFTALPAGYRESESGFWYGPGAFAFFWTSTPIDASTSLYTSLNQTSGNFFTANIDGKRKGCSVRCIKD